MFIDVDVHDDFIIVTSELKHEEYNLVRRNSCVKLPNALFVILTPLVAKVSSLSSVLNIGTVVNDFNSF